MNYRRLNIVKSSSHNSSYVGILSFYIIIKIHSRRGNIGQQTLFPIFLSTQRSMIELRDGQRMQIPDITLTIEESRG